MASRIVKANAIGNYPNNIPTTTKNGIIITINISAIQRETCCQINNLTQLRRRRTSVLIKYFSSRSRSATSCCSTSKSETGTEDSSAEVEMETDENPRNENREEAGEGESGEGYLVRDYYGWKVRRMVQDYSEMRKVALVQALAFHEPALVFNEFFFQFFQAEVLSALINRLQNSPLDRYACLVAEPEANTDEGEVVGVVDATVLRDEAVLEHLPVEAQEYLYVSGIAVLDNFRRKKVGSALLEACEKLSSKWGMEYLVLRAYEDDKGALKLYGNAGYKIVGGDLPG